MNHAASPSGGNLPAVRGASERLEPQRTTADVLDVLAREAATLLQADRACIFLLDREMSELWSIVTLGGKPIRFDARLGVAGAAALNGRIVNVEHVRDDPRFHPGIDARTGYRTRNLLAIPLRDAAGEIVGAVEVLNKKRGAFTTQDEEVLGRLAKQVGAALDQRRLEEALTNHRESVRKETDRSPEGEGQFATQNIVGTSEKIQHIVRLIQEISDSAVNVLITGESGTGKEMVAQAIHCNSPRARIPLVSLNCAALPESLVESELFGIEKGVATGVEPRIGKFEAAQRGTLFLDEIGDLTLVAQAKILRVLQERMVERVGGRKSIPVDARIVAATNKDLESEVRKGTFRADLYHRLNVIHIRIPPLREIPEDIPLLASYFLRRHSWEMKKECKRLSVAARRCLAAYDWPGNTRQLENEIKRLVVSVRRAEIGEADLPQAISESGRGGRFQQLEAGRSMKHMVAELEMRLIREGLEKCHQNQLQATKRLGLSRQGLIKKMKRYGIQSDWTSRRQAGH